MGSQELERRKVGEWGARNWREGKLANGEPGTGEKESWRMGARNWREGKLANAELEALNLCNYNYTLP
jgi:hypothetical protein